MSNEGLPKLMTPEETGAFLGGIKVATLAVWRCHKKKDLPWIKIGRRVFYRPEDVTLFVERRRVDPNIVKG